MTVLKPHVSLTISLRDGFLRPSRAVAVFIDTGG